jgi:hypothetical protein
MVALLFLEVSMMVCLEVALDLRTREVVSFRISDPLAPSGAISLLHEFATSDSSMERRLEVERFRLDAMILPDTA